MAESYVKSSSSRNPWSWIPTLYFSQGLPFVAVMSLAVIMYKNLGLSNADIAWYTSWLYLPWVIKPLWSPFVDIIATKRTWIIIMQAFVAAAFAGVAFFIPASFFLQATMAFFWLMAFSSATHDIAVDGYYMLALDQGDQSFFVGIRNIFYRLSVVFGQGVLVMFAGLLQEGALFPEMKGKPALAWSIVFFLLCGIFMALFMYHRFILPSVEARGSESTGARRFSDVMREFFMTFVSFFRKKDTGMMFFFLLTYRLGESQLVKIAYPFLMDDRTAGGLGITTSAVGVISGTIGVIALLLGGILGGYAVSRDGFRKWIVPMALAINVPDLLYVLMAACGTDSLPFVALCVSVEQLGYGFGFTAYMLYLIYISEGEHKTSHYAIGTGFMAMGMMLPGMAAGVLQEYMGYVSFFVWVCVATVPGIVASVLVRKGIDPAFGKKV